MKLRIEALERQLAEANETVEVLKEQLLSPEYYLKSSGPSLERMYECKLCMNVPIQCVFLPCGHTLSCRACSQKVKKCPVCQMGIEDRTSLHMM